MINQAKKLNDSIKELSLTKEYLLIKEKIKNDEYLNNLLITIKNTQNEMKDYLKNNQIKEYNASKQTLELLKEEFLNHPLINNYIVIKDEMYQFLEQLVTILSD